MDLVVRCYLGHRLSLRIASCATLALNAAEWLRLGFLMGFVHPVTLSPGPKSTYTRV
jgi:hypothetical protein